MLRALVRNGDYPDNHLIISIWLERDRCCEDTEHGVFCQSCSHARQWSTYVQQAQLLIDTMADELIAKQWRCSCVNHMFRPMSSLKRLVRDDVSAMEFRRIEYEYLLNFEYIKNSLC
ncbi:MAG: hypothetical protein SVC26_08245 [Pseudomonadota bacterium]|nr:hypothetical protein [Pseudomonadota bacterium]